MRYLVASVVALFFIAILFPVSSTSAIDTVPTKMNFQGRLTDTAGNVKANGTYNMRFKLYTVASGGSNVWAEDRLVSATQGVTITNGTFSVQLGSITTLPASLFASGALYLEVEFPTPATATSASPVWTEGAMAPRNQMLTSAYAYNAETVDGIDGAALAQLSANNTFTGTNTLQATSATALRVQSAAGANTFLTVDTSSGQITVGNAAADGTAVLFRLDDKNTTGDPAGVAGGMYYNSFSSRFRCYQGAAWADCIGAGGSGDVYLANVNTFTNTNTVQATSATAFRVQSAAGANDFLTVDTSGGQITVGNAAADGTAVLFRLDDKNTTGDPTGVAGAMYYNSFSSKFRCYQGAAWADCISAGGGDVYLANANVFTNTNAIQATSATAFRVQSAAAANTFLTVDTSGGQVTVGNAAADGTAVLFRLDDKNTTGDPTGVAGATYYNSFSGKFRCFQGAAWADCITAAGATTLQDAYNNSASPALITTTAAKGINVTASAAPTTDMVAISNTGFGTTTAGVNGLSVNYVGGAAAVEAAGVRIDLTPGTTTGGTWSGLRVVSAATGPVTGVTSYGIKLEGPTTPGAGTEVGMGIASGYDIGLDVQSGGLQLADMADPAAPTGDNLKVYARKTAGRMMLRSKAPSGVDYVYQPSLFQQQVTIVTPGILVTTISALGNGTPVLTGTGAAAATTQAQGAMNRITSGTTAGTGAGVQTTTVGYYRGTGGTNADGFFHFSRINFADTLANYTNATTGARFFTGLSSLAITGATSMVSSDNPTGVHAGFQYSAVRDTGGNFQFITDDGSTQTVTNTGVALASTKTYDFYTYTAPGGSTIFWRISNLTDGVTTEGSVTATLPTATTAMRTGFAIAPLSTTAKFIHWQRLYTESDR